MNKIDTDLEKGRNWLLAAERRFGEDEDPSAAHAAAMIGHGFVALAHAARAANTPGSLRLTSEMPPALIAAVERAQRTEDEARPHDDEPRGEAAYLLEGDDEVFTAADGLDTEGRYDVRRRNDPAGKHASCWYFVLDPRHDDHARAALAAYADSCESKRPMLAADLRVREIQAREADRG